LLLVTCYLLLIDPLPVVELQDVAFLDRIEAVKGDAALVAGLHLSHVVREALERRTLCFADDLGAALDVDRVVTQQRTVKHHAAGHVADAADLENLAHHGVSVDHVAEDGLQHAGDRLLQVVDDVVDDRVQTYLDLLLLG